MLPLLVSVSTAESSYNTTRADWFYSNESGLQRDRYSRSIGYSNATNEWNNTSQATIKDDGIPVGSFVSVSDGTTTSGGVTVSDTGFIPGTISTYAASFEPSFALFPGIKLRGSVKVMVAATFDVERGTPSNVICAIKAEQNWALRWTGVPQIDRIIFESGREIWSFVQEYVFDCPKAENTTFDASYEIKMEFSSSYKDVWRFGLKAIHNLISSSWNNITLKPIAPAGDFIPSIRHKREITTSVKEPIVLRKKREAIMREPLILQPSAPDSEKEVERQPAFTPDLTPTDDETAVELMVKRNKPKKFVLFKCLFKRKQKP